MHVFKQVTTGVGHALVGVSNIRGKSLIPLAIYFGLAAFIFSVFSWFLVTHEDTLRQWLFDYLLPSSWHGISEKLIGFFFESQTKLVLASMIINGAIVAASICLFPIKEWCSQRYEEDLTGTRQDFKEFPLWQQGIEETKLLAIYVAAQSVILGIGYYPYAWCNVVSNVLSIAFLFFAFGLDFISPAFQRRRIHYSLIIKLLTKNSFLTLGFGALFSLPVLLLSHVLFKSADYTLVQITVTLLLANIAFFTLAIPAGTHCARQLLDEVESTPSPQPKSLVIGYGTLAMVLALGLSFHFVVASSMHHKSQLLKCNYSIDWASLNTQFPGFRALLSGKENAKFSFNLEIENPTPFNLDIENSTITFWHNDRQVAQTKIKAFAVAAGQTYLVPMDVELGLNADNVSFFSGLSENWTAQMELELLPGIPFIIKLI